MKEITSDSNLVAYCGLFFGACGKYLKEKCPGCHENEKATWCKIRTCCIEKQYSSCAECKEFTNVDDCKKFNNFIAKIFGLIFRSNRKACIDQIKVMGIQGHSDDMAKNKLQSKKR